MTVAIRLALSLPRDAATVTLARRILDQALSTLGVAEECRGDVGLILAEACANVVTHAVSADVYAVSADVIDDRCVIRVSHAGPVTDPTGWIPAERPPTWAERGRGLHIISALADGVTLSPGKDGGVALEAVKLLSGAPGDRRSP